MKFSLWAQVDGALLCTQNPIWKKVSQAIIQLKKWIEKITALKFSPKDRKIPWTGPGPGIVLPGLQSWSF